MEVENISSSSITSVNKDGEDGVPLPGFRFHPTDEELVGFYLRRKVEKKSFSIELIKQADIYKYDPWDLPKSGTVGDKEWYFYCKRGRKYRNSIRPNRVTGSGFWKATGIDRPIYSSGSSGHEARDCIGLKKSLVYYRGSAGKGTKTDWMMHEFRLPASHDINMQTTKHIHDHVKTAVNNTQLEAEVWTLCRIFKRNVSYRKCVPDWREIAAGKKSTTISTSCNNVNPSTDASCSSKTCSTDSSDFNNQGSYIRFNNAPIISQIERKPYIAMHAQTSIANHQMTHQGHYFSSPLISSADSSISSSNIMCADVNHDFLKHVDWEDLRSIMDYNAASIAPPNNNINPSFYI